MPKSLTVWITTKCGKFLKRWEYQTILAVCWERRPTPVSQEAAVRTLYGTTEWFRVEEGVQQGCLMSPCLFNLYTEHIMRNAGLDGLQAGIKIGRRNINNFKYADDTTLMAESEEELRSLLMMVKEESERASLKLNIKNIRSWHHYLMTNKKGKNGSSDRFSLLAL